MTPVNPKPNKSQGFVYWVSLWHTKLYWRDAKIKYLQPGWFRIERPLSYIIHPTQQNLDTPTSTTPLQKLHTHLSTPLEKSSPPTPALPKKWTHTHSLIGSLISLILSFRVGYFVPYFSLIFRKLISIKNLKNDNYFITFYKFIKNHKTDRYL